jgi:hypothetical protein
MSIAVASLGVRHIRARNFAGPNSHRELIIVHGFGHRIRLGFARFLVHGRN